MNRTIKEIIMWVLISISFLYLYYVWGDLPQKVATHYDLTGNPNGWTDKNYMPLLIGGMNLGTYLIMILLPYFDPKKKIEQMGEKYNSLRILMSLLMTAISIYMLYITITGIVNLRLMIGIIAVFFALMGNYMQTLRPNYFFGIRSPWTLENDETWRKTHRFGGRLWMVGGIIGLVLSILVTNNNSLLGILFAIIVTVFVLLPFIYSYLEFRKIHKTNEN